jgi:hypothetical protein
MPLEQFISRKRVRAEPLVVDSEGRSIVVRKSLNLLGALGGHGKTTLFNELALHGAAGVDYLCFRIPEPFSTLILENEGPEDEFALKLKEKLTVFPHKLQAKIHVHTFDWGGFSLADKRARERLVADIAEQEYDLVFGDPLDSLGIEGVGSPDDTRKFVALMKEAGLNSRVAWWLNTHPRKEETKEALNEIAGAWGGKPDTVLLMTRLDGDRTRIRFPKLRWAKRGTRPPILLDFDPETESFSYLGEERAEEERAAKVQAALEWIVAYVEQNPGMPRGKVEMAFHEAHRGRGRTDARRAIDTQISLADEWAQAGRVGECSARLATGPGESARGTYLYPAQRLDSPLADPLFSE